MLIHKSTCFVVYLESKFIVSRIWSDGPVMMRQRRWALVFWGLLMLTVASSHTVFIETNELDPDEISFLQRYGYLPQERPGEEFAFTPQSFSEALRKAQAYAGLPQTGVLDTDTKKLFSRKRCGMKDLNEDSSHGRSRRFVIYQGWNDTDLTYRVVNGPSAGLSQRRVEELVGKALGAWGAHSGLRFSRRDAGQADFMVSFVSKDHGDGTSFDGEGSILGHAFPPPSGAVHFDDDEIWGENENSEDDEEMTDFYSVALHEIGHALGLLHSDDLNSVMYAYYKPEADTLQYDDILGIMHLYPINERSSDTAVLAGTAPPSVPGFTRAEESDENYYPDLCETNYDTLQVIRGQIYVFEEEWVWVLRARHEFEPGYPKRFHDVFRGLPAHVTAVRTIYENSRGNVVIFSGLSYWEFDHTFNLQESGQISKRYSIPAREPELTTVFLSNYNNKTYLMEEEKFWRFDEQTNKMDRGYPKSMAAWRELPFPIEAAIVWEGDTYFFKGGRFWRFDNKLIAVHENYPLPVAPIWFNCELTAEMNNYVVNDLP